MRTTHLKRVPRDTAGRIRHQSAHFPRTPRNTHTHTHVRTVGARARRRREGHAHCISSRPTSTERPRTQQWNAVMTHLRRRSNITQHTSPEIRRTFGKYLLIVAPRSTVSQSQSSFVNPFTNQVTTLTFQQWYIHNKDFKFYLVFTLLH